MSHIMYNKCYVHWCFSSQTPAGTTNTYFISYILNISEVFQEQMQCYKVSGDPNEALKYLSPCLRKAVEGFSQLCIEPLTLRSSKVVHIYH